MTANHNDFLEKYSHGKFDDICSYSQYLTTGTEVGLNKYKSNEEWIDSVLPQISEAIKAETEEVMDLIKSQPIKSSPLCRVEKADYSDVQVGDVLSFGIKSTTRLMDFADRIFQNEVDGMRNLTFNTEFVFNSSKSLDISFISYFEEQEEELICGSYKVVKVEEIKAVQRGWERKRVTWKEFTEFEGLEVEHYTSKKGSECVRWTLPNGSVQNFNMEQFTSKETDWSRWHDGCAGRKVIYLEAL